MEVLELKEDNSHKAKVEALKLEVQKFKTRLVLCKTSTANGATPIQAAHKLDVPKPKEFKGNRFAKDVDNFIWSMERYFGPLGNQNELAKVRNVSMFPSDNAIL